MTVIFLVYLHRSLNNEYEIYILEINELLRPVWRLFNLHEFFAFFVVDRFVCAANRDEKSRLIIEHHLPTQMLNK